MSKHHRTAGTDYQVINLDGTEYKIRPLTVGAYSEMEAYIVSLRSDPLGEAANAVDRLPPQHHAAIWEAAMKQAVNNRTVTGPEAAAFENSIHGLAWKFWQCLKQDHPDIASVNDAMELLSYAGSKRLEEISKAIELGSGEADLEKSSGQALTETAEAVPAGQ